MVKKFTNSFIVYERTDDIYKDMVEEAETRFDTSNHELDRSFQKGKHKKVIGSMKVELCGKIMKNLLIKSKNL